MSIQERVGQISIKPYNPDNDRELIVSIYHAAMLTEPWFEDLPRETIIERINNDFFQPHSMQYIGKIDDVDCTAMWWDETNFDLLCQQRSRELASYWKESTHKAKTVWFRDLLVAQEWQGKGIGSQMVDCAIQKWKEQSYEYALLRIHLGGLEDENIPSNIKRL